jgi:PAS domain S-box-containing protein
MSLNEHKDEQPGHRPSWSLRNYMALFMAVLLAVAGLAAFAVRAMSESDARQAAVADANYAARAASALLATDLGLLEQTTAKLATNPQIGTILSAPAGTCNLTFSAAGHLDVITPDGTVKCSSQPRPSGQAFGAIAWLPDALRGQVTAGPFIDPVSGKASLVVATPVAGGVGVVAAIIFLGPLGAGLASTYGGARQLEFLVTTPDGKAVLTRSLNPDRWVGAPLAGTSFGSSSGPVDRSDLDGKTRLYGWSKVSLTGWTVFVGADAAAALAAADLSANRFLLIVLAGVAAMSLVILIVYRRVAEPVRRLSLAMRGSAPGNAVATIGAGTKEVTDLAEDFDRLMATLKRELTDRLDSEQAAVVSERNYRLLFEAHPQPMWLYDMDTLAFLDVNDAAITRYGYSHADFLAMTIKDIRPPQDLPKFLELIAVPLPAFDKSGPWRYLLKDGSTVQVLVTSHAVTFAGRNARFVLAEDLTESQRLELELHQSQARVEAAAELNRAKDEMVSMVSHEMRTPLASIVGFTELLATREVSAGQRKEYLSVMLQEAHRLTALINDFLDLRRIEGGHMTMHFAPANISALIKRAVALFSDPMQTPIELRLQDDLPLVRVDSESIFRVMANLLSNARKYSPMRGPIVVAAQVIDGSVEIRVEDEGLGIPSDALSQLFQKFFRVDTADRRAIKGTGLGLAISKKIIEAHGGDIGARSDGPGKGATFYFTVPAVREQADRGDVLVVEDDSGFAHLLEAELSLRGLAAVWAPDAETAEHLMKTPGTRAVVLDLLLPGLSGEAFLNQLRERHGAALPVVVVTLKDLDAVETMALQKMGVTAVFRKGPGIAEAAANLVAKSLAAEMVAS